MTRSVFTTACVAAVAHHQVGRAIVGDAPAFGLVRERSLLLERVAVVHESDLVPPGELQQLVADHCKTLGEILPGHVDPLQRLAGLDVDAPQRGFAFEPGTFVQLAVGREDEPLRER
jgi:hypothetical protein